MQLHQGLLASLFVVAVSRDRQHDDPPITYQAIPNLPSVDQSFAKNRESTNFANWAASEAHAAVSQARAAEGHEASAASELAATKSALEAKEAVRRSKNAMQLVFNNRMAAEAAAKKTRKLVDQIPSIAMKAAKQATDDVVAKAVAEMEAEARKTVDEALAALKAAQLNAAKMAQQEAQPFIDAKIRAEKSSLEFLRQARVAAAAATEFKKEALHVGSEAAAYQAANNPIVAQTILNKAHILMDKGMAMANYANNYQNQAGSVRGMMVPYGLAEASALKYGAYEGNPGGNLPPTPPLPAPLKLPPPAK